MSLASRREYLATMRERYWAARTRRERTEILNEVQQVCGYHRKYTIRVLRKTTPPAPTKRRRKRALRYLEALPVIARIWEALDYPCAERLHPVLLLMAEHLAAHGEVVLTGAVRDALRQISRATLARRLAAMPSPKPRRRLPRPRPGLLQSQIPMATYDWDEARPGALEVDLVEHNGGSTAGQYAYTLSMVDIVTGWSRRRALLGRSQRAVHEAIQDLIAQWPYPVWGLHTDNGAEFVNHHLHRYAKVHHLTFTRSRPYRKNDNAHVEQRNRQLVREIVGYARYDRPEQVEQLNRLYARLDLYANLFLPTRKLKNKVRDGARVRKSYDAARPPLDRILERDVLSPEERARWLALRQSLNPLQLHRELDELIAGLQHPPETAMSAD
ncbi:DDE-type integrase/transposase/recombinase [Hydrogenibacillus schlegelii]|uniref:Integrase n=1 Tax=Hydrogenibacillus schlegelii TaxID=1484 RepID=A0A132N3J7_HYDSH|nr:DDE-type integrase/transposase/recombinase [Hydrogenibacillus schlegelii]KWX04586.1 integrase [Hydrogenibacillus schlegelii]OAR04456.1 integrase [Hydrogenibacillus schlegelii]